MKKKKEKTPKKYTHSEWVECAQHNGWLEAYNEQIIRDYTNMFFHAMTDVFGFGKEEFQNFIERLNEIADLMRKGEITWYDLKDTVLDELNVKYIIK